MLKAIQEFWVDLADADVLVLATTRPQGYSDDFSPAYYNHLYLAPLSAERALCYGKRLANALYSQSKTDQERVASYLKSAATNEATARLMRSPLQVTIMANLVDLGGEPPQERWRLFQRYFQVIYDREIQRRIPASEILRDHRTPIEDIHGRVGLRLQIESEKTGQTSARLSLADLHGIVDRRLDEAGFDADKRNQLATQIIQAAGERLVFLVGVREGQIGFEIRSLQEFFAAEAILDGADKEVTERLKAVAPIPHWRNVFLFAASRCNSERQYLRNNIVGICGDLNSGDDPSCRLTRAGSVLALDLLQDLAADKQPSSARQLARIAWDLAELPASDLHRRLASTYGPAVDEVFRQEMERRLPLDVGRVGDGSWAIALPMVQAGIAWAAETAAKHWPQDQNAQIEILTGLATNLTTPRWLLEKAVELIPKANLILAMEVALRGSLKDISGPPWLRSIEAMARSVPEVVKFYIPSADPGPIAQFYPLWLGEANKLYGPVLQMPATHPVWQAIQAAVRFSVSPSRDSLAAALRELANNWPYAIAASSVAAWPLACCLDSARSVNDLRHLALRAEQGQLGDLSHWQKQEEIWRRNGFSLDQLRAEDPFGPLSRPPASMVWTTRLDVINPALIDSLPQVASGNLPWVADLLANTLASQARQGTPLSGTITNTESIQNALTLASSLDPAILNALQPMFSENDFVTAAETIGQRMKAWMPPGVPDPGGQWVSHALRRDPNRLALLPLIVLWLAKDAEYQPETEPASLPVAEGTEYEPWLLLLRLSAGPDLPEGHHIAQRLAAIAYNDPSQIETARAILLARYAGSSLAEQFAAELYLRLPRGARLRTAVLEMLTDNLRRRTSGLAVQ